MRNWTNERLAEAVNSVAALPAEELGEDAEGVFLELRHRLTTGTARAASPGPDGWQVHSWVKEGVLLGFRLGRHHDYSVGDFHFFDKHTYPPRPLGPDDQVRIVPGGTSVRSGAYLGPGVVIMPPAFVNTGAYVDEGAMIDSHVLVGSCAQIGRNVHLSAGVQIGGVLEPIGALPVIIEDDVLVGGNCGVYEATIVGRGAVLAPGTILTRSTKVYDTVEEQIIQGTKDAPLLIPEGAVIVPGSRPARGSFAAEEGLSLYAPIIVKYRDEGTEVSVALEDILR